MVNKKIFVTLVLCLISGLFGSGLLAYNTGDYRTKWGGLWETHFILLSGKGVFEIIAPNGADFGKPLICGRCTMAVHG